MRKNTLLFAVARGYGGISRETTALKPLSASLSVLLSALILGLQHITTLHADDITVVNHTDAPIWVGVYRLQENLLGKDVEDANLQSEIVQIPADGKDKLNRPPFKIKINREIIFSDEDGILKNKFNSNEYKLMSKTPIGIKYGSIFHIAKKNDLLHGYCDVEWKVVEPIISATHKIFKGMVENIRKKASIHSHGKETAYIRRSANLANEETDFLAKRIPKVKQKLEELLKIRLDENEIPRIAICMSGGGMRAATTAQGLLEGLDVIGLLEALTYAAGLSGSTWTLASFVELGLPIEEYSKHFVEALCKPHVFTPADLAHVLWPKYVFEEHTSIVDLYGVFLAQTFFHSISSKKFARQDIHLSDSQRRLSDGNCFFPIYTSLEIKGTDSHWATYTPYEFGIDDFNAYIPIWALGRKFNNGVSTNFAPEQSLGFLMGIWGSAGSGSINNILKTQEGNLSKTLFKSLNDIFVETHAGVVRIAAVRVFNPLFGVTGASIKNLSKLTLMDSGYDFNLPFPPLLKKERKVDVIIVMDASANVYENSPALQKAVEYAKARGIPLPNIELDSITDKQVTVFADESNVEAPTIIFLAPVKNTNYDAKFDPKDEIGTTYDTTKFFYKGKDVTKLSGLIRQNIIDNKNQIFDAIRRRIELKRQSNIPATA
jgi:phospholipase A2